MRNTSILSWIYISIAENPNVMHPAKNVLVNSKLRPDKLKMAGKYLSMTFIAKKWVRKTGYDNFPHIISIL